MNKLTRRYVYEDDYNKIIEWGIKQNIKTPNGKINFPTFLSAIIKFVSEEGENV